MVVYLMSCPTLHDPVDCSPPGSSSMGFPRQEYRSKMPFPSPGDLLYWGIRPACPALQAGSFTAEPPGKPYAEFMSFRIDWLDLLAVQRTLQESSPAPQSKSINSSVLSLLYGPALASIHDYWKHHSFDHTDFVCKVILLLLIHCLGLP